MNVVLIFISLQPSPTLLHYIGQHNISGSMKNLSLFSKILVIKVSKALHLNMCICKEYTHSQMWPLGETKCWHFMIKICLNWLLKFVNELFINLLVFLFSYWCSTFHQTSYVGKGGLYQGYAIRYSTMRWVTYIFSVAVQSVILFSSVIVLKNLLLVMNEHSSSFRGRLSWRCRPLQDIAS